MDITEQIQKKEIKTNYRFNVEKLDGGFISDVTGKRSIYRDARDITDYVGVDSIIGQLKDDEYVLNIDIIQKDRMADYVDLMALHTHEEPVMMSYEEAKAQGIIQVDVFDPNKPEVLAEETKEIAVTARTAYSVARLKAIDWNHFDEQYPMNNTERAQIAGMSNQAMYNQFRKSKNGKATYHLTQTRVGMTILAQFYEKHLGIRSSTKDQMIEMKDKINKILMELELMTGHNKFTHSREVNKKVTEIRKIIE